MLMHPSYEVEKTYVAKLNKILDKDDIKMMLDKEKVNCKYNTAPACGLYLVNVYY